MLTRFVAQDNGVKLVDPRGEMLEASWETHATVLANAPTTRAFIEAVSALVQSAKIDLSKPARVVYARDTRPSGPALISALEDGLRALGVEARDGGVTTTPILHYLVKAINTKGTADSYGDDSENGYYTKLSQSFQKLIVCRLFALPLILTYSIESSAQAGKAKPDAVVIDCANGVGAKAAAKLQEYLGSSVPLILENIDTVSPGKLNDSCGADYVKTMQRLPPNLVGVMKPGQRACSLDGDADRLMYYYLDQRGQFHMLDGDKIAALVAGFIVEQVKLAGLESEIRVGVVQTAYANGASTKYLAEVRSTSCDVRDANTLGLALACEMCGYRCQAPPSCRRAL